MPALSTNLLTDTEQRKIYALPELSASELTEYFTFNKTEIATLQAYTDITEALYFAISLASFKLTHTLVDFTYRQTTLARRHVMQRYFPNKPFPLSLPSHRHTMNRIENNVLAICGYKRCQTDVRKQLENKLATLASRYPKQRALCKALLNLCIQEHIAIPAMTTLSVIIRDCWQQEQQRLRKLYKRYTTKTQRQQVATLLHKNNHTHTITALRQEMKSYATHQLIIAIDQHALLCPLFLIAKELLPRLTLPTNTLHYYASLVEYYKGARLKQLQPDSAQLYLLCYVFTHYQVLNDQLLDGFKKRALEYKQKTEKEADALLADYATESKALRRKLSEMLIAIKNTKHKTTVPKKTLFRYVPEDELEIAAHLIMDEKFDADALFWKLIDKKASSIRLNLRPLFLALDLVIMRHEILHASVEYLEKHLCNEKLSTDIPTVITDGFSEKVKPYLMIDGKLNLSRFEYWVYWQLGEQISSNKLTLKYTVKYKPVKDDLMPTTHWKKNKTTVLKNLQYPNLTSSAKTLLKTLKEENSRLYKMVNQSIRDGDNPDIIVSNNPKGKSGWHLKPLEQENEPNDSLFEQFPKTSIVTAMQFVEGKIGYTRNFHSIVPHSAKYDRDPNYINAGILANALRMGTDGMGQISDLNPNSLTSVEAACIRMETLIATIQHIQAETAKLPIFTGWNVADKLHGSIDGMKLSVQFLHHKARYSPKYFGYDTGVSSINLLLNHFPMTGMLIGEMNMKDILPLNYHSFNILPILKWTDYQQTNMG